MTGYQGDDARNDEAMAGGWYHTGDVATRDADGWITYVGRTDDVFKASDYKISPFEVESVLIEHPAVAEAAVVPAPDAVRLAVPKAYVVLAPGHEPSEETARSILEYAREHLAAVAAGAAAGVLRAAEDDLREDPPGRAAGPRGGPRRRATARPRAPSGATTCSPTSRPDPLTGVPAYPAEGDAVEPPRPCRDAAAGTVVVVNGASAEQVRAGSASRPSTRRPLTSDTSS